MQFTILIGIVFMILSLAVVITTFSQERLLNAAYTWLPVWLGAALIYLLGFYFIFEAESAIQHILAFATGGVSVWVIALLTPK